MRNLKFAGIKWSKFALALVSLLIVAVLSYVLRITGLSLTWSSLVLLAIVACIVGGVKLNMHFAKKGTASAVLASAGLIVLGGALVVLWLITTSVSTASSVMTVVWAMTVIGLAVVLGSDWTKVESEGKRSKQKDPSDIGVVTTKVDGTDADDDTP